MSDDTQILTKEERKSLIPNLVKVIMSIPAVQIDGALVMCVAFLTAVSASLVPLIALVSNDNTYEYLSPFVVFCILGALQIISMFVGALAAALVALQSYRSKVFADHSNKKSTPPIEPPK